MMSFQKIYSPTQLANAMKLVRQQNGWTQSELAKKIGIKQATISNFENNPDNTTLTTFFKILQSLELSMTLCDTKNASPVLSYRNVSVFDSLRDSCHANISSSSSPPLSATGRCKSLGYFAGLAKRRLKSAMKVASQAFAASMLLIPLRRISLISRS